MRRLVFALLFLLSALNGRAQFTNVVVGTTANDGTGDALRTAFQKLNFADNWLKTNLTTVSNLVSGASAANKVSTNNGTHWVTATGSTTTRSVQDRFAAVINANDYGIVSGILADRDANTLALQRALDAAIANGSNAIEIEYGSYYFQPFDDAVDHVFVIAYCSNPAGSGKLSATNPTVPRQDGAGARFQPFTIRGKGATGKRPDSTGELSKGVTLVFDDMDGHTAFETGNFSANVIFENLTLIGSGWADDSRAIRHNVSSSMFDPSNVTIQQFGIGLDLGGDLAAGDTHADFVEGRRVTITECEYGVKISNANSYVNNFHGFKIEARIPIWNAKASAGVTPSGSVNIVGGFYYPAAQYGGILLTGVVTAATSSSFTVGSLGKITKARNGSFVMEATRVAGSINDVEVGMLVECEKNHIALGVAQIPWRSVANEVTAINTGTSTITVSGLVYDSVVVGQPIYIAKTAWAFYGDQMSVKQAHIEEQQADDVGFGASLAWAKGWRSSVSFEDCVINMQGGESGWSAVRPWLYHEPVYSYHPFFLSFERNRINALNPKIEVTGAAGVYFFGNQWQARPLIIDHTGQRASGVARRGEGHFLKGPVPYLRSADAEHRDYLPWMGSDEYIYADGLSRMRERQLSAMPTSGTTGETFTYVGGTGTTRYRVGSVSSVPGYFSTATISAGNGAISAGSNVLTLTNTAGIWDERVISIAGAGAGGAALIARVEGWWESADGSSQGAYLHANAGTTVTAGTISAVAPVFESNITAGSAILDDGAAGAAMLTFKRAGVATNYISLANSAFSVHEGASGRKMFGGNHNTSTNALDIMGLLTAPWLTVTNAIRADTVSVNDLAYNATTWNASTNVPTQNAVRDEIEALRAATQPLDADLTAWAAVNPSAYTATAGFDTLAELNAIIGDADVASLAGSETLSNKTLASPTVTGSITFPDDTRQTFNPGANAAGLNVGSHAGDPGTPSNGDIWYDSVANELTARINGANVALGAGGGGLASTDIDTSAELDAIVTDDTGSGALVFATSPTLVTPTLGVATATSVAVDAEAYDATGWDSDSTVPTKNDVRDKIQGLVIPFTIPITKPRASGTLVDASTYYFGTDGLIAPQTTEANSAITATRNFTIKAVFLRFSQETVSSAGFTSTVTLRVNGSDTDTLSTTVDNSTSFFTITATGLNRSVTAGQTVSIKWVTPSWSPTNPASVTVLGFIDAETAP